jgi:cytosine/adenosine deaminase-related metal-dependent hydrolase
MRFLTAEVIYPITTSSLEKGVLQIDHHGIIKDIIPHDLYILNGGDIQNAENYEGYICPGFINCHCHLELSYLKGVIPVNSGMADFIRILLKNRFLFSKDEMEQSYIDAENEMIGNGIVAVGDISNFDNTLYIKSRSRIYYHTFVEVLGLDPFDAGMIMDSAKLLRDKFKTINGNSSIVPHASYTISPRLFDLLKEECYTDDLPVSIHMQESPAEEQFIYNHTGPLAELFDNLNFNYHKIKPYGIKPLKAILPMLPDCNKLLLIHNTLTTKDDIQWAGSIHKNLYWNFCPRANLYIENRLPDVPAFISENAKITIGTDSLASNDVLNVLEEINTIKKDYDVPLETALKWATYNGAEALGISNRFGSFEIGKQPAVINVNNNKIKRII